MKPNYAYVMLGKETVELHVVDAKGFFAFTMENLKYLSFNPKPTPEDDETALWQGLRVIKICGGSSYYSR